MSKFCGRCGSLLDANGKCSVCIDNHVVKEKNKVVKNKRKLLLFVMITALALAICGFVCFKIIDFSALSASGGEKSFCESTNQKLFFKNNGNSYYAGGACLVRIENDDSVIPVKYIDENGQNDTDLKIVSLNENSFTYDGTNIFAIIEDGGVGILYKFTFKNKDELVREELLDKDVFKQSVLYDEQKGGIDIYAGKLINLHSYGDYIYFNYVPSIILSGNYNYFYRIGKISKNGSALELIEDEIVSDYTIKNDLIYFYNNGYHFSGDKENNRYTIDRNEAGIYKMKCDGSNKVKLLDDFYECYGSYTYANAAICNNLCGDMSVYDDYLYFIDYRKEGKSRVCRIKIDGSDFEYLTESGAYNYTIDVENNILYYIIGEYGQSGADSITINKIYLDNRDENEILTTEDYVYKISAYDNCVYFTGSYKIGDKKEKAKKSGMIYDSALSQFKNIYGYTEIEWKKNKVGIPIKQINGPYFDLRNQKNDKTGG